MLRLMFDLYKLCIPAFVFSSIFFVIDCFVEEYRQSRKRRKELSAKEAQKEA